MYKVKFLTLHRPDRSPSQRFRFEQFLKYLSDNGMEYDFSYLLDAKDDKKFYSKGKVLQKAFIIFKSFFKRLRELRTIKQYDAVYVQRECFMLGTSYFEKRIAKKGVKLIFDFDDSIWLQNVSNANKMFVWLKNPDKTAKIIEVSNTVIAGNEYLKNYALKFNDNVVIVPTTIDTDEYQRQNTSSLDKVTIGWSGSITTIQHFEHALPFLRKIKEKYGDKVDFKVIGDPDYVNEELGIKGLAWTKETEIPNLSSFDIGIMPLPDDEWAKGKCGLKGLQYMALEIPTLMSPVGVNTEIIQDGENGFIADHEEEWTDKLSRLIESEELRKKLGKNSRKTVLEKYSTLSQKEYFLSILKGEE